MSTQQQTIWLTGASSGIGRALALELAARGHRVIASARGEQALQELAQQQPNIVPLPFDVTDEAAIESTRQRIQAISPQLDRAILNAGTCEYLDIDEPDWTMMARIMAVNFGGTVNSVAVALPLLQAHPQQAGHLVGVVSQAHFLPFPRAEAYGASKAAQQYFLDSLRVDLGSKNVDVTVINPGFVKTPLTDKNDFPMPFLVPVAVAARRMADAIERRPLQYDFPRRLKWSLRLLGMMPRLWNRKIAPAISRAEQTGESA